MDDSHLATHNPWATLSASERQDISSKKKGGKSPVDGGPGLVSGSAMKAGSDAIATFKASRAVSKTTGNKDFKENMETGGTGAPGVASKDQSWTNISSQQRARKKDAGQKCMSVSDAISELEAKSREVHTVSLTKRCTTWAQWCRRMEDVRVDADSQYVDDENGNTSITFTEVFLRSSVIEDVVKSSMRNPLSDETELHYLFSLTLYGDSLFHDRLAKGLRSIGEFFNKSGQEIPHELVSQISQLITSLKINPNSRTKRAENLSLQRLEEQISMNVSKFNALCRPDLAGGTEAKCKAAFDVIRLNYEKLDILNRGIQGLSRTDPDHLVAVADELLRGMAAMREPLVQSKTFAEQQYSLFQAKLKTALSGEDTEYLRVLEVEQGFETEIQALRSKEDDLRRQLELVSQDISAVQQRQRQHKAQSAKVLAVYNERMKTFHGEDSKVKSAVHAADKTVQLCQSCCDFLQEVRDKAAPILRDETENRRHSVLQARRQALIFLALYLESIKEKSELADRRHRFCTEKVEAMRREQRQALELGMADMAADLGASICKLEQQHERVVKQDQAADLNLELVHNLITACSQPLPTSMANGVDEDDEGHMDDVRALMSQLGHPM